MWHKHIGTELATMEVDLGFVAVVSREEDEKVCQRHGIHCVWEENSPLGRKFNKLVESVSEFYPDYDAIMIMGSDDFVSTAYVQEAAHLIRQGGEYINARTAMMADLDTGRMVKLKGNVTIGAGRMVRREIIEACGNRPWHDEMENGLDKSFDYHLRLHENDRKEPIRFAVCEEGTLLITKQKKTQMWTFDFLLKRVRCDQASNDDFLKLRKEFALLFDNLKYNGLD